MRWGGIPSRGYSMEVTIPDHSEETVRLACAEMATALNQLRECPREGMDAIIADATYLEEYITNGATICFVAND